MRTTRTTSIAALVLGGGLLLSGCASGGPSAADCEELSTAVRDISNGAQNTLASVSDPAEAADYFEELQGRVTQLGEDFGGSADVDAALSELDDALAGAAEAVASALVVDPDDEDAEPNDFTAQSSAVQEAAAEVGPACTG